MICSKQLLPFENKNHIEYVYISNRIPKVMKSPTSSTNINY